MTAVKLWERSSDFVFALGELEAFEGRLNLARDGAVTASDSTIAPAWSPKFLVDGIGGAGVLQEEAGWLEGLARRRMLTEQRERLANRHAAGLRVAQERLRLLAAGLVALTLGAAGFLIVRGRVVRARELEVLRQQISRDLHDEVGSNLCSIRLMAEISKETGRGRPPSEVLSEIRHLAEAGTESLRDMVWLLKEGGQPQIGVLVEKMRAVAGGLLVNMEWTFCAEDVPEQATAPLSFHRDVLFILREALHNVVKHAGASVVEIRFAWFSGGVELSVRDRGEGFELETITSGDGIENMRYRAVQLGGTILFESVLREGTRVYLKIPKP
jgi:signal transduction histidine kinase